MSPSPRQMLHAYVRAFESQDAAAVVPFYRLPCTFIRPDGVWIVSDEATAMTLATHMIDHARSQGYCRTDMLGVEVKPLAAALALLTGVFVRYDTAGQEIQRFGVTYIVRDDGDGWKIAVAIAHDVVEATAP